jgi:hypothetical protein
MGLCVGNIKEQLARFCSQLHVSIYLILALIWLPMLKGLTTPPPEPPQDALVIPHDLCGLAMVSAMTSQRTPTQHDNPEPCHKETTAPHS